MDARQRQNKLSVNYTSTNSLGMEKGLDSGLDSAQADRAKLAYLDMVQLTMRLHARLMAAVKLELERQSLALNGVQGLLLYHIGDGEITAGELVAREHYLGSNASYNLKKLADKGWVINERSSADKRAVKIRLSEKGKKVHKIIDGLFERHLELMALGTGSVAQLSQNFPLLTNGLQDIDRLWRDQVLYQL